MIDVIRKLLKPKYESLNTIEIIKNNLFHNLEYLSSLQPQAEIFPVLKSNAYGYGLKEICQILNETTIKMVAVDSFPEAQIVYKYFNGKVLILEEMPLKAYRYCKLNRTEFVVYNDKTIKYLSRYGKRANIHLFVNTGMNREGIDDLGLFLVNNEKYINKLEIIGLCSHLAEADNSSSNFNQIQEDRFLMNLEILHNNKIYPKWLHLGNSAGAFILNNKIFNAFRPGLAFYGYNPFKPNDANFELALNLKPALRVYSTITNVRRLRAGEQISYGDSFRLENEATIATIPFGYFEGLDRRLSNCAKFLFNKNNESFWFKIAGKVCMNLTCINCQNREVEVGDKINIISDTRNMDNSIDNLSDKIGIINYEFLIRLNQNIKRKIV
ncbi:MAG TPA: alanine racemase [bacterium]|nr:alanine racemase [bacterium]